MTEATVKQAFLPTHLDESTKSIQLLLRSETRAQEVVDTVAPLEDLQERHLAPQPRQRR
jgi:hypothetical protein